MTCCHIVTYHCMICDVEFGHVTAELLQRPQGPDREGHRTAYAKVIQTKLARSLDCTYQLSSLLQMFALLAKLLTRHTHAQ